MDRTRRTKKTYSFLWRRIKEVHPVEKWHFNKMQEVLDEPIPRGIIGIDIGSGCGYDTYIMAKNNPSIKIISIDISDGVYTTRKLTSNLKNVYIIKCSVSDIPLKKSIFDFAYSFGVLHHTVNPKKCISEISRVLKKQAPIFAYLYEDHSENPIRHIAVKIISKLRIITPKLHPKILYVLCWLTSPFIFVIFSFPSKILKQFKLTGGLYKKIPFNFGTGFFSLCDDLYDRLSAPIEHRFSRQKAYELFSESGFQNIGITRLNDSAGWVIWGYK